MELGLQRNASFGRHGPKEKRLVGILEIAANLQRPVTGRQWEFLGGHKEFLLLAEDESHCVVFW